MTSLLDMAAVAVLTGPISAQDAPGDVPFDRWPMLVEARQSFAKVKIPYDCRELLRFVQEARDFDMIGKLGYKNEEDFIRRGLEMDPETVGYALAALERIKPAWALPFREAVTLGKQGNATSERTEGDTTSNVNNVNNANLGRFKPAKSKPCNTRYGSADHWLARLDRDQPELAAAVRAGTLTANAAAKLIDLMDRATQRRDGRPLETVDNVNGRPDGNTAAASIRRLRKDRPDLHQKVISGELSANAAAIQAGFRRRTVTLPADPVLLAGAIVARHPEAARLIREAAP